MGYENHRLEFNTLRQANVARLPQFKNSKGEPAHSQPDGSDWKLSAWSNALCGEVGEAANLIKKYERGDLDWDEFSSLLSDELADIATYLDILAFRAGILLDDALISKWNRVSKRVGSNVYIAHDDYHLRETVK